jgi:hypothetical protein
MSSCLANSIFGIYFDLTPITTIEPGFSGNLPHRDGWPYQTPANPGRIAPPMHPDLVSDRDSRQVDAQDLPLRRQAPARWTPTHFETFSKKNVELVDATADGRVEAGGDNDKIEAGILPAACANAVWRDLLDWGPLKKLGIKGRGGTSLHWARELIG